jgi:hypothetical protein
MASLASTAITAAAIACGAQSDFMVRSDPTLAPVRPADCSTTAQTPPEFTWPPQEGEKTYTVILRHPDGRAETRTTTRNWLAWDQVLEPGTYTWQVKFSPGGETGAPRRFTIAGDAVAFLVPDAERALEHARAVPHPRTWPRGPESPLAAVKAERARGFAALIDEVEGKIERPVEEEPKSESINVNYEATVAEQKRTLNSAFAWAATHDRRYGADAARRLLAQAAWSATGPISFKANDTASRNVAWTLALGYDWAYDYLAPAQRATILAAIRVRTRDMYDKLIASDAITAYPYDSHGNLTLTLTAAIAALVAGDVPQADAWFRDAVPAAVVWTSPWGANDGGFGNGTAYGLWDTQSDLIGWYVLKNAAGIDIARKEWVRNHPRYLAYFVPPGTPSGTFGDGSEDIQAELQARVADALSSFVPSPLGKWYAAQLRAEDPSRLEVLLAPRAPRGGGAFPAGTPNDAFFPSIGWVAMHSSLADPQRASVYFKSSPYGSYNHSHADQNSFIVNYRGERLAIQSGYYDDYRTPHWTQWYKQTRSANAITFDGGQGQGTGGKQFAGEVDHFESDAAHAFAVGHAERAYGGALTRAQRSMLYLRPDVVLVHDVVASAAPRTWEWNIHALDRMRKFSERRISITRGKAQMCVEMLSGPEVAFSQTDRFSVAPASPSGEKRPNQWHGVFATTRKSTAAEFVVMMRIGADCSSQAPATSARRVAGGWEVAVDGRTVKLSG